jgi:hypothetical protein
MTIPHLVKTVFATPRKICLVNFKSVCNGFFFIGMVLKAVILKECATPNWMLTLNHRGFIRLLKTNFSGIFDLQYLFQQPV